MGDGVEPRLLEGLFHLLNALAGLGRFDLEILLDIEVIGRVDSLFPAMLGEMIVWVGKPCSLECLRHFVGAPVAAPSIPLGVELLRLGRQVLPGVEIGIGRRALLQAVLLKVAEDIQAGILDGLPHLLDVGIFRHS